LVDGIAVCHDEGMKGSLLLPRIIWASLFGSTLLYVAILELATVQSEGSWPVLLYPLVLAAVSTAGASLLVPRIMLRRRVNGQSAGQEEPNYLTELIVTLALAESVAIFGLVLGFLGAPARVVVPFFAVTWVLMLLRFPTHEKRARFGVEQ
jgi:F0F1-type ATP synthase membrane subunit c/vacuolar-type H+-ATPase subunit K